MNKNFLTRDGYEQGSFVLLLIAVTLAFGLVIFSFWGAIFWAVILALIFYPLHRCFLKWFGGRKNVASVASLSVCIMLAIVPVLLIGVALIQETMYLLNLIKDPESGQSLLEIFKDPEGQKINLKPFIDQLWNAVPESIRAYAANFVNNEKELDEIFKTLAGIASSGAATVGRATKTVFNWGQSAFGWVISFVIMLYLLFFMFRDGDVMARSIVNVIPLSEEHKKLLFERFATVVKATVKGNVVVAVVQGALGGLAFSYLQIEGALLWAVLMSVLSLLPAVGASLVWGPVALYFIFFTGRVWEGVALVAYGAVVIGMIDNLLRPILIGKDTKLPDYVVLVTTLGGMALVGLTGFVVGPLVAALFLSAWGLLQSKHEKEAGFKKGSRSRARDHMVLSASSTEGEGGEFVNGGEERVVLHGTPPKQEGSEAGNSSSRNRRRRKKQVKKSV